MKSWNVCVTFKSFFNLFSKTLIKREKHGNENTVKLGNKERFDKEQIGDKEPFPVTNL